MTRAKPTVDEGVPTSLSAIRVAALKVVQSTDFDIYMLGDDGQPALFRSQAYPVSREDFERLEQNEVETLYVASDTFDRLANQLRDDLTRILASDELSPTDRFQVLEFAVESEVTNAFRRLDPNEAVHWSHEVGQHLVQLLHGSQNLTQQLFRVMKHDFSTFSHVVNVSSYCVVLAQQLGINGKGELQEIAVGGMLHDIGKRHISPAILNKRGPLTQTEYETVKQHPIIGYSELCERSDVTFPQLMMIYQHHERIDGTGYPVGCPGSEIHQWARICAVVDVFDAITGERPYRPQMSKKEALGMLNRVAGKHLDPDMVRCWTHIMGAQG